MDPDDDQTGDDQDFELALINNEMPALMHHGSNAMINEIHVVSKPGVAQIEPKEVVRVIKEALCGSMVQIVAVKLTSSMVSIALHNHQMVEDAVTTLNAFKMQNGLLFRDVFVLSTAARSDYSIRTDKIPKNEIRHWFEGGKINVKTASEELGLDNPYWFGSRGEMIDSVTSWQSSTAPDHCVLLIYVKPDAFDKFMSTPVCNTAILIGLRTFRVYEEVTPVMCFKCLRYGHRKIECTADYDRCRKCAEYHVADECTAVTRVCAHCKDRGGSTLLDSAGYSETNSLHSPFSNRCPCRKAEKDKLRLQIKAKTSKPALK